MAGTGSVAEMETITAIRAVEALRATVIVASADVADEAAMRVAVGAAEAAWGGLDGVIHAAGLAGAGRLATLAQADEVDGVIAPKVDGLDILRRILGAAPLDFVALMSSINAVVGAAGASDYAAANAALDAFVDSAERPAKWSRVLAIGWGPWQEVGMAARRIVPEALRSEHEALMSRAIPPDRGVELFAAVIASGHTRLIVAGFEPPEGAGISGGAPARDVRAAPVQASSGAPAAGRPRPGLSEVEAGLANIWAELTGVAEIGPADDFFELGGHSLLATRMITRVSVALGVDLALRDIFEAPKLGALAERVVQKRGESSASAERSDADDREEILI
jgi:NAD(P)-dependent dehydrogenase (short-subunit alcohol dehydrogenase family)/acyl carrier protein